MIKLSAVSKMYGENKILENLHLSIAKNERIGLFGDSGSGKSTILKLISGLVQSDNGTIEVQSSHIGYIFQDHRLIPWKSALDNIAFSLICNGFSQKEAREKARVALNEVELSDYEDFYPGQLNGGMCQRVSIARAFVISPDILLMDEPFSALDSSLRVRMNHLVQRLLTKVSASTIYVTHNKEELNGFIDRAYTLTKGGSLSLINSNEIVRRNDKKSS